MITEAFWTSATRTNTNSRRRLLRSYEAFVYCWSRTSRPRPRLLALPRTRQRRKRCERGRKRGKRGGIRARLRANPTRPALPNTHALKRSLSGKQTGLNSTQSVYTAWGKGLLCVCFHRNMAKQQHPGLRHSVTRIKLLPSRQGLITVW